MNQPTITPQPLHFDKRLCLSLKLENHPLFQAPPAIKKQYLHLLWHYVVTYCSGDQVTLALFRRYCEVLLPDEQISSFSPLSNDMCKQLIFSVSSQKYWKPAEVSPSSFWERLLYAFYTKSNCVFLLFDCLFLTSLNNKLRGQHVLNHIKSFLRPYYQERLDKVFATLYDGTVLPKELSFMQTLVDLWRINTDYLASPIGKIMVTATVSAGKSTLINALAGKTLMNTAVDACTGHLSTLYAKPTEDHTLHIWKPLLDLNASMETLKQTEAIGDTQLAAAFYTLIQPEKSFCILDTPGVNSATHQEHGQLTRQALKEGDFDRLIYVLNASSLASDDEKRHLKFVFETVPEECILFVISKLDCFDAADDSVETVICEQKDFLREIGFKNPVVCPVSAAFILLLKRKMQGEELSRREERALAEYEELFSEKEYDLSGFYDPVPAEILSDRQLLLTVRSGFYGLEQKLFCQMPPTRIDSSRIKRQADPDSPEPQRKESTTSEAKSHEISEQALPSSAEPAELAEEKSESRVSSSHKPFSDKAQKMFEEK